MSDDGNDDWLGGFLICYLLYLGFWVVVALIVLWVLHACG